MGTLYQFKSKQQIEDILIEKEYHEFIKLLHSFVETQTPKYELLKIMVNENKFIFYDKDNQIVDNDTQMPFDDLDYDNVLISALINFAPKKIEIIQCDDEKVLKSINDVFANRIVVA